MSKKTKLQLPDELNVQELLAELEAYRWREKKALILNKFGYRLRLDEYDRKEKLEAYEKQKWVTFIKLCFLWEEVDALMLQGYTFDEIIRAIKEHIAETLAEEKENDK